MKELVKKFYIKAFPTDDYGPELNDKVTFEDVYTRMCKGEDFYEIVGVSDSLVRERIFQEMADRLGADYDDIYDIWINGKAKNPFKYFDYTQKLESELKEGRLSHAEELSQDELYKLEKEIYSKLNDNNIYIEDCGVSNSTNMLADIEIDITLEGDWKHDHLFTDELIEEFAKENRYVILKEETREIGDSQEDYYKGEHIYHLVKDTDGQMEDRIAGFRRLFGENINESADREVFKKIGGTEIIKDGYGFGIDDGYTVNRFIIDNDGIPHFDEEPTKFIKKVIYSLIKWGAFNNPNYKGDDANYV